MSIRIEIKDGYIVLDVASDITISYPIYGDEKSREEKVDSFSDALKKALKGERISTLY